MKGGMVMAVNKLSEEAGTGASADGSSEGTPRSYPRWLATLLNPDSGRTVPDPGLFRYSGEIRDEQLEEGLRELHRLARLRHLWGRC